MYAKLKVPGSITGHSPLVQTITLALIGSFSYFTHTENQAV